MEDHIRQELQDANVESELIPWRLTTPSEVVEGLLPFEIQQQELLKELIYTERTHRKKLLIMKHIYKTPLCRQKIITYQQAEMIFPSLEEIVKIHSDFCDKMRARQSMYADGVIKKMADILLSRFDGQAGEKLCMAVSEFATNHSRAAQKVQEFTKAYPSFKKFLQDAESDPYCNHLQLQELIHIVRTRLTKYQLLIESICKLNRKHKEKIKDENKDEAELMETALLCVKNICSFVNREVKHNENLQRHLQDYQTRLDTTYLDKTTNPVSAKYKDLDLTAQNRELLHEGVLNWKIPQRTNPLEVRALLLTDILVLLSKAEDGSEKLLLKTYMYHTDFSGGGREEISPVIRLKDLMYRDGTHKIDGCTFLIVDNSRLLKFAQIYEFIVESKQEKKKWGKSIEDALQNAQYLPYPETNEATLDDGGKPNYAVYLERAAAKGIVTTRISNLGLLGAAGTGKTSIKRLLTGQEPVYVHNSTPVLKPEEYCKEDTNDDESTKQSAVEDNEDFDWDSDQEEPPVTKDQTTKPQTVPPAKLDIAIACSGNKWNLATQDTLLMRLANCVEIVAELERLKGDTTGELDGFSMEKANNSPTLIDTNQPESSATHNSTDTANQHESSITHDSSNEALTFALSHASSEYDEIIKLVLDFVTPENLKKLGITHFVGISDTGGQAAFLDVAPALLRFNSVNLILIKLNERLEDPAQFFYSVNGVRVGNETRQISTRSLVHSFIASKSKIQKPRIKGIRVAKPHEKPMFMILGTHFDKYKEEVATPSSTCQTKEEKNESLKKDLFPFKSSIHPNKSKMFFSLDTRKRDKDTLKLAFMIRKLVSENYAEAKIPVSWYIFQLAMNKIKMEDKNEGMILLSTLTMLGRVSKMSADEVEAALEYFHDLQVCMFYPSVVPNVVFTDPQYLLNRISEIIAFSYGSGKIGMAKEFEDFTKCGRFKMSLLGSVCKQFKEYFSEKDFLALMVHLFIISSVPDTDEYFIPCVLAEHPNPCEGFMDSSTQVEPLLLTWPNKCAPNGLFPSLSTNIQSNQGFNNIHFKMSSGVKQYRNRITLDCHDLGCEVILIECDSFFGIAVHSMCLQPDSCVKIRGAIFSCLGAIVKRFGWLPSLVFPEKVFLCKIRPECESRIHFCYPSRSLKVISCEIRSSSAVNQKDSHSVWWGKSEYQMNHSNGLTTLNLFRLLQNKSSKWDDIGRELNISKNFRATLDHDRSKTDDGRLEAVLEKWLEENLPKCTWYDFKKILTDNLKYNDMAEQISAENH